MLWIVQTLRVIGRGISSEPRAQRRPDTLVSQSGRQFPQILIPVAIPVIEHALMRNLRTVYVRRRSLYVLPEYLLYLPGRQFAAVRLVILRVAIVVLHIVDKKIASLVILDRVSDIRKLYSLIVRKP